MISRSEWSIPPSSVEWIRTLCFEMGVDEEFWLHREYGSTKLTMREMMTMTLIVLRLRLRHEWHRDELSQVLRMSFSNLHNYEVRGKELVAFDPSVARAFTKMEGKQAVSFLIVNWGANFQLMFDEEGVAAE